ncbi:hypothetical protein JCM8202v2_002412 [Rhodotorula sphaerocarpa]
MTQQGPSVDTPDAARPHVNVSKFATGEQPTIQVPMRVINRPIASVLDEDKVKRFVQDIENGDDMTPIEVLKCVGADGQRYYFAFGGCHRCDLSRHHSSGQSF